MLIFSANTFVFLTSKNLKIKIYKTIILPENKKKCLLRYMVMKHGVTLRDYRHRVFENSMLR